MAKEKIVTEKEIRKKTIFSLSVFVLLIGASIFGWQWLNTQSADNGIPQTLRTVLNNNESFFTTWVFNKENKSKSYPVTDAVSKVRVNGNYGMSEAFDPTQWKLKVIKGKEDTMFISLAQLKILPKTEVVFDFKCIEGWSQITHWGGVKFSDFLYYYHLSDKAAMMYTGLVTPDKEYYVGIDNKSMLQPQTILCYEMNGKPLPVNQGYPLRLIIPVKYGIKHLKRIGTMFFSNEKPPDYWYERGYDYYAGL